MVIIQYLFLGLSLAALIGTAIASYRHAGIHKTMPVMLFLMAILLHLGAWILPAGTPEFASKEWSDLRVLSAFFCMFTIFVIWIVGINTAFKFGGK